MTQRYLATPDVLGYKPGAVLLALIAGTTDQLENVQSVQGQPYSLLRAWQPSSLSYVTLQADASGNLAVAGGTGGGGSTSVDATLKASTAVIGHVIVDSGGGAGSTAVDATITNPTTSVTITNPTTAVDATLSSASSTRLVGQVTVANPTTAVSVANPTTSVTITNPATAVDANLTSAGSSKVVGTVNLSSGSQAIGSIIQASGGSSATPWWMELVGGSSANTVGAVALVAGSSANTIGAAAQGPGSTANYWTFNSVPFSSGGVARTSVATSIDAQIIAANANRKALVIANGSTSQTVAIGLTTAVMTTALANLSLYLQPTSQLRFGICGDLPLYTGPVRGINITSTALGGGVVVTEYV